MTNEITGAIICGYIIGIILNCIIANFMKNISILKGYGTEVHAWALCFWFGVFGWIYVLALPDKILQGQNQQLIAQCEMLNRQNQQLVAQNELQNKYIAIQIQMLKKIAERQDNEKMS